MWGLEPISAATGWGAGCTQDRLPVCISVVSQLHWLLDGRQSASRLLQSNSDSGHTQTDWQRFANNCCIIYEWGLCSTGCQLVVFWLYFYIRSWLPGSYVLQLSCCFAATSLFVEKLLNFCVRSVRFCLDSEWMTLVWISIYVDTNRFAVCLSQLITVLSQTDCMKTWPHSTASWHQTHRLTLSHCWFIAILGRLLVGRQQPTSKYYSVQRDINWYNHRLATITTVLYLCYSTV